TPFDINQLHLVVALCHGKGRGPIGVQWRTILLDSWCPMEYKRVVQTVVETPTYLAIADNLFGEEERVDIVALVAADPECGDLICGTGGFRKVRVARKGMGKSGGARVVYIWRNERFPVFLITVFPKNEKENLSMAAQRAKETGR
ncbi:MAG: type II toxin-antitoxin system RelE/ParE family toxin, partial [Candidatus Sulfotelmatobacter sp.]